MAASGQAVAVSRGARRSGEDGRLRVYIRNTSVLQERRALHAGDGVGWTRRHLCRVAKESARGTYR